MARTPCSGTAATRVIAASIGGHDSTLARTAAVESSLKRRGAVPVHAVKAKRRRMRTSGVDDLPLARAVNGPPVQAELAPQTPLYPADGAREEPQHEDLLSLIDVPEGFDEDIIGNQLEIDYGDTLFEDECDVFGHGGGLDQPRSDGAPPAATLQWSGGGRPGSSAGGISQPPPQNVPENTCEVAPPRGKPPRT